MESETLKPDDYKIGYSSAIAFANYEGQLIWRVFSNMLAVNTFLTGFNIAIINQYHELKWFIVVTSLLGLVLCLIWYILMSRMFSYYAYWFAWAREYEKKLYPPDFQFINNGRDFGDGNSVKVGNKEMRMPGICRIVKNKKLIHFIIILISFIYLITMLFSIFQSLKLV